MSKNVVVFSVVLYYFVEANETSEFSLVEGSSSNMVFLVQVKHRAEISFKVPKIG